MTTKEKVIFVSTTEAVIQDPIKEAIRLSQKSSPQDFENIETEKKKAAESIAELNSMEQGLLPIERGLVPEIKGKKEEITNRIKQLDSIGRFKDYAVFNLTPFTWRDEQGFPRLAAFSILSPTFEMSIAWRAESYNGYYPRKASWSRKISPKFPKDIEILLTDVFAHLKTVVESKDTKKRAKIEAEFSAFIPLEIKEEILGARKHFKDIFIIAAITEWNLGGKVKPDPSQNYLVVGYDGVNYWLITAFDKASLSECMVSTYSSSTNLVIIANGQTETGAGVVAEGKNVSETGKRSESNAKSKSKRDKPGRLF